MKFLKYKNTYYNMDYVYSLEIKEDKGECFLSINLIDLNFFPIRGATRQCLETVAVSILTSKETVVDLDWIVNHYFNLTEA